MFINKTKDGKNNLCGPRITALRKQQRLSQRALADQLQLLGLWIKTPSSASSQASALSPTSSSVSSAASFISVRMCCWDWRNGRKKFSKSDEKNSRR